VKRLEDGKVPLEESVTIYERGEALKRRCEELLRQAEARVDKITTDANGQVTGTEPPRRAMIPGTAGMSPPPASPSVTERTRGEFKCSPPPPKG